MTVSDLFLHARHQSRVAKFFSITRLFSLRRQRQSLGSLSDELLEDIGITREAAQHESERPFWDAPDYWIGK